MMSANVYRGIWVFTEQRDGQLHEVGLELVAKAKELAAQTESEVSAVLMGHNIKSLAQTLIDHGADLVLIADDSGLDNYQVLTYTFVLEHLIKKHQPEILLLGATAMGVELAPRVAARVRTGLSAHCIDLKIDNKGRLLQVVPGWEGGVIATITCPDHRPQMATVMPGAMKSLVPTKRQGEILEVDVVLPAQDFDPKVIEIHIEEPREASMEKADVIVAGGWGIGNENEWKMIETLAGVLGGAVGATRPAIDEGWAEEWQMIGQSGKTVRPTLYIGIGISGVMHHVVGMDQSRQVISINTDPNADIFDVSDVIVVEDFRKILPKLIQEIQNRQKVCV